MPFGHKVFITHLAGMHNGDTVKQLTSYLGPVNLIHFVEHCVPKRQHRTVGLLIGELPHIVEDRPRGVTAPRPGQW